MSIVVTHGYLLTGTGSNLYVNNLVREYAKVGEDVCLLCQDPDPIDIDFVNEVYQFDSENNNYILKESKASPFKGKVRVFQPNLNGFLPVYVYDHYDGFEVKEFPNCSDEEVASYLNQNAKALTKVVRDFNIKVVNTNHLVMFPSIATKVKEVLDFKHVITVHGSALNFTVKKDKRFEEFAKDALSKAEEIVVDSLHADVELKEFLDETGLSSLKEKVEIIPAGVDVSSFDLPTASSEEMISNFQKAIAKKVIGLKGRSIEQEQDVLYSNKELKSILIDVDVLRKNYDYRHVDQHVVEKIEKLKTAEFKVMFVGKYLWTKGIYLILFAIPRILKEYPNAQFVFVGFGPFREPAEFIVNAISRNKLSDLKTILSEKAELFHGEDGANLPLIESLIDENQLALESIVNSGIEIRNNITFTGIAAHKELVDLIPAMTSLIAPSVFPEAFGMVAIEAMACGVYPVLTYQSAFKEISDEVIENLEDFDLKINKVFLDRHASENIASNIVNYFAYNKELSEKGSLLGFKKVLRDVVLRNYSWEGIAQKYLKTYS